MGIKSLLVADWMRLGLQDKLNETIWSSSFKTSSQISQVHIKMFKFHIFCLWPCTLSLVFGPFHLIIFNSKSFSNSNDEYLWKFVYETPKSIYRWKHPQVRKQWLQLKEFLVLHDNRNPRKFTVQLEAEMEESFVPLTLLITWQILWG